MVNGYDAPEEAELEYTKQQINSAGRVLRSNTYLTNGVDNAMTILDYWRAVHSHPMQVFYVRLRRLSKKLDKDSFASQRLKRAYSIFVKLRRKYHGHRPSMDLYQIQDIAGCRTTLSNVGLVKKLVEESYIKGELKHKLVKKNDYIEKPKEDGYRGMHLIYSYNSDKERKKKYNGLLVEVQIRSRIQHLWATAVETTGLFTREAIKSSEGSPEWIEFFKLVSSAFARMESCPIVPNTPDDERELYLEIKKRGDTLKVINKMRGWTNALKVFNESSKKRKKDIFFLLELDIKGQKLTIHSYGRGEENKALDEYGALEKRYTGDKDYDVVLVGVAAAHDLENAYPNYYGDTQQFLDLLHKIISKY